MSTPNIALTLNEFFKIARISKPSYYLLEKQGKGPKVVRLGRKVFDFGGDGA